MSNNPSAKPGESHHSPRLAARFRLGSRLGVFHFSAVWLLASLVVLIFASPFLEQLKHGDLIETILMTTVLVCSVLAIGGGRRMVAIMSLIALPVLLAKWLNQIRPDLVPAWWFLAGGLGFCAVVIWRLLRFVLHSPKVSNEVLCASIAAYLLVGLVWSFGYIMLAEGNAQAFLFTTSGVRPETMNSHNAYYFSFVTLSTVGYGDIVPVSSGARMLSMSEAVTGMLYVAIFIARLVALQTAALTQSSPRNPGSDKT